MQHILERLKHLPGKHNQASHGRKRGGSSGGSTIDLSVEARKKPVATEGQLDMFGMPDTSAGKSVNQQLDEYNTNELVRRQRIDAAIEELHVKSDDYLKVVDEYKKQKGSAYEASLTMDTDPEINKFKSQYLQARENVPNVIREQHRARGVEISQMSADAQNALFDSLSSLRRNDGDMQYTHQVATTLGLYGNPDLRMRIATEYYDIRGGSLPSEVFKIKIPANRNPQTQFDYYTVGKSVDETYANLSLEMRMVTAKAKYPNLASNDPAVMNDFAGIFNYTHTSQSTVNEYSVLGASMQTAVSQVGPNRGLNPVRNFWDSGVKPPMPHPEIVAALQFEYESHQQLLRDTFPEGYMQLYRGEKLQPGQPYEPFSTKDIVAKRFSQPGGYLRDVRVPIESVFTSEYSSNWRTDYSGESEYLVLGTHFSANTTETPKGTFEWNGKDVAIVSNYSDTSKSYIERLKHLPGKHNQGSHGRKRGGSGGGSVIDLPVEARKKPVVADGQLDMFGMLDTSAGKSVQQQLNEFNANELVRRQRIDESVANMQSVVAEYTKALTEFNQKHPGAVYPQAHPNVEPYLRKAGIAEGDLMLEIQKQHRARGAEISQMSVDAQNTLYDSLDLSVNDRGMNYAHQTALALGIYGNPDLRMRIAEHYYPRLQNANEEIVFIRVPKIPNARYEHEFATSEYGVDELVGRLSLEYRLVQAKELAQKSTYKNVAETFAEAFTYTHTSQTTTGSDNDGEQVNHSVLGAAMQTAVSQIGPNRGLNPVRNYWPDEVKPPMPHPEIVAALQSEYDSHQQLLRSTFPDGYIPLYRGEKLQPGQPYEPFTANIAVAKRFSQPGGYLRDVRVPIESVFTSPYSSNWRTDFAGEEEYLVLGTHFSANTTETPKGIFDWNGKEVAIVSNYSDTSKSYIERLKHLPGKHNQGSHGRKRGGSGGGSVIDLSVEARKKPVVADGQLDMFGMLDTSAGKSVQQQLNEFNANELVRQQKLNNDVVQLNDLGKKVAQLEQEYDAIPIDQRPINPFTNKPEEYPKTVVDAARDVYTSRDIVRDTIAKVHQQRSAEISHMSDDAQNALFDSLDLSESAIRADATKNQLQVAFALGLYGNPDIRMRVAQKLDDIRTKSSLTELELSINPEITTAKILLGADSRVSPLISKDSLPLVFTQVSLEHRMLRAKARQIQTGEKLNDVFVNSFTFTHTTLNTVESQYSVLGAAMQTAVSQVGPNRGLNPVRNFWPTDVKPPMPHPEIVAALQSEYESHQRLLRKKYPKGYVQLYRGEKLQPGQPYEPFSTTPTVAKGFLGLNVGYLRDVRVPIENIFTSNLSPNWNTAFSNEKEYLVMGTSQIASQPEYYAGSVKVGNRDVELFSNYLLPRTKSYITRLKSLVLTIMLLYS